MSGFTVEFEFEIGDLVYFKSAPYYVDGVRPKSFTIIERMAQECHGGIQRQYLLDHVVNNRNWIPCVALTRDEPLFKPPSPEHQAYIDRPWVGRLERLERAREIAKESPEGGEEEAPAES